MKRIYYFAALAAVAGVMTSCSSSDDVATNGISENIESANLGITNVGIETGVTSRAATVVSTTSFANNSEIGVSLFDQSLESSTLKYYKKTSDTGDENTGVYKNKKWTVTVAESNSTWAMESGVTMPLFNTKADISAYYPFNSDYNPTEITMKASDKTDYMYHKLAQSNLCATNATANLSMTHAQAIIAIQIKKASTSPYSGAGKITSITVHPAGGYKSDNGAFAVEAKLNSTSGLTTGNAANLQETYTTGSEKTVLENSTDAISSIATLSNATDYWFVTPLLDSDNATLNSTTAKNAKVSFTIVVDGQTYKVGGEDGIEVKTTGESSAATPISRGKAYFFTLSLSDANLGVSSVSISDWTTGGTGSGDLDPSASAKGM